MILINEMCVVVADVCRRGVRIVTPSPDVTTVLILNIILSFCLLEL